MKARFDLTIRDIDTDELVDIPEDTLEYLEGVIEDAVEQDRRVIRSISEDTDLEDAWQVSALHSRG